MTGLSADNPKAHIISIIAAVAALHKAEVPLTGRVVMAFGAGGAPSNKRPPLARWRAAPDAGIGGPYPRSRSARSRTC